MSDIIWPDYYSRFQCIAGRCRHTCCLGWEIDIDKRSLARFMSDNGVMSNISNGHFILKKDGRCPYLNSSGLCNMIISKGEDYLCDICRLHPRFFIYRDGRTYGGIGLACEEAARVILDSDTVFSFIGDFTVPGYILGYERNGHDVPARVFGLWDKALRLEMRVAIFEGMESLYNSWREVISDISGAGPTEETEKEVILANSRAFDNLVVYLLYRHEGNQRLAMECAIFVADMVAVGIEVHEAARMFSEEVEYSDSNMEMLEDLFGKCGEGYDVEFGR